MKSFPRALPLLAAASLLVAVPAPGTAQAGNPYASDPAAVRAGSALFGNRCAECHGADAKGFSGPDLTVMWADGTTDERVFGIVREGIPGSIMPSSAAPDHEIWAIVAYLKSVSTVTPFEDGPGEATVGAELFSARCARCHRVGVDGGVLGPDLTSIGRVRSRDALTIAIRDPGATVGSGYRAVSLLPRGGEERVRGVVKGEDAFSIQILDTGGRLRAFMKDDLDELVREDRSLMPAYGEDRLGIEELDHLLAFLGTLRGSDARGR